MKELFTAMKTVALGRHEAERDGSLAMRVCTYMKDETTRTVNLAYLKNLPTFRAWLGDRKVFQVQDDKIIVVALPWESTIEVHRKDLNESRTAQYNTLLQNMGVKAGRFPTKLFFDALKAADATVCYDGQYFFDTDHPDGKGSTQSNKIAGTGTTQAQIYADWGTTKAAMRAFKTNLTDPDDTTVYDQSPNLVICPLALEDKMKTMFKSDMIDLGSGPVTNIYKGDVAPENIIASGELTDANDWYAFNIESGSGDLAAAETRPFLLFVNEEFNVQDNYSEGFSESEFQRDMYEIGGKMYMCVAPYAWYAAIKRTNT